MIGKTSSSNNKSLWKKRFLSITRVDRRKAHPLCFHYELFENRFAPVRGNSTNGANGNQPLIMRSAMIARRRFDAMSYGFVSARPLNCRLWDKVVWWYGKPFKHLVKDSSRQLTSLSRPLKGLSIPYLEACWVNHDILEAPLRRLLVHGTGVANLRH